MSFHIVIRAEKDIAACFFLLRQFTPILFQSPLFRCEPNKPGLYLEVRFHIFTATGTTKNNDLKYNKYFR
jgi:hypothetical protein